MSASRWFVRAVPLALLWGCAKPHLAHGFKDHYLARTRTVALAPLANNTTIESAPRLIWQAIYAELRAWQDDFTVTIQHQDSTRRRLRDAGIAEIAAGRLPTDRLCAALGTDAILRGTITSFMQYNPVDQSRQAIVLGVATGSQLNVDFQIRDCSDTALVWAWKVKQQGGFRTTPEDLREVVGSKVAEKFPYRR